MSERRNQLCPCGSGKRLKHCCGALALQNRVETLPETLPESTGGLHHLNAASPQPQPSKIEAPKSSAIRSIIGSIFGLALPLLGLVVILVLSNAALYAFGAYVAPLIWTSEFDKECQAHSYWYARNDRCAAWYAAPGRRGHAH